MIPDEAEDVTDDYRVRRNDYCSKCGEYGYKIHQHPYYPEHFAVECTECGAVSWTQNGVVEKSC